MAIVNQHINEFLDYYLNLSEPQYAVLLSGKWGSGKTFFINEFKEKNKSSYKFIHISLFGLKSKEDIHKQVIFKLFGLQSNTVSKTMEIAGKVIKGILKKYAGVNIALSDIPIDIALKRESDQKVIFIFDDLERIDSGLSEVLGYLNVLVEELDQKVILLANEEEIKDRQIYDAFKEKTIGKTFHIQQNFHKAFEIFVDSLSDGKKIIIENRENIEAVFDASGYKNLRSLRQGMLDFNRLIGSFTPKFQENTKLMTEFIQVFFAFSLEVKSGKHKLPRLDISHKDQLNRIYEGESEKEKPFILHIVEEYNLDNFVLPNYLWLKFYWNQYLDAEEISNSLSKSRYFFKEEKEEWINLWHYLDLEEEEFKIALNSVLEKLNQNEYLEPAIFMHVVGILLRLNERNLYSKSASSIVADMKKYINDNRKNWIDLQAVDEYRIDNSHIGLGYMNEESNEFQEIKKYLLEKSEETIYEGLPQEGSEVLASLGRSDIEKFIELLSVNRETILYRLPVFQSISPDEFFETLKKMENKYYRDVMSVLKKRYERVDFEENTPLLDELDFWKKLFGIITTYIQNNQTTIKTVWFGHFCASIEKQIIQKIEKQLEQIKGKK
ncbi:MAG: hypothetical protein JU82_10855 [Sulfuricurvum sp. MLSB]|uniref:P-loop NTPase fold protein n=1 Tax=unclassified Sulfuricurvum TaxID=2632390 RepID=UPI00050357DA|nr:MULTISPECIES: P-loop NTPase fold protein [unclassified Sulfuricurvum]KFN38616.1 MAG: hypothetical protein JU82_10855 [Sulfuricurvum sp. MLSB]